MSIQHYRERPQASHGLAQGLGWLSLALGAAQLAAPERIARALGMRGSERMIQACGMGKVAAGIGVLAARNPAPWLLGKAAGEGIDLAGLAAGLHHGNRRRREVGAAMAATGAVALLDIYAARKSAEAAELMYLPMVDYSDRDGYPKGFSAAHGAARDFNPGRNFGTPEALRPWRDGRPQNGWSEPGGGSQVANSNLSSAVARDTAVLGGAGGKARGRAGSGKGKGEPGKASSLQKAAGSPERDETFTIGETFAGKGNEGP